MPVRHPALRHLVFDWYILSLLSVLCYGVQNFFYKIAAERRVSSWAITFFLCVTGGVQCLAVLLYRQPPMPPCQPLVTISALSAGTYFATTVSRIEALRFIDATIVFPVLRTQTALLTAFSLLVLDESISPAQWAGIGLAAAVVVLSTNRSERDRAAEGAFAKGMTLAGFSLVWSCANWVVCRYAARGLDLSWFFVCSFFLNAALALPFLLRQHTARARASPEILLLGFAAGTANVLGAYALLSALKDGPLFAVGAINNQSFIVTVLLAVAIYNEPLTARRIAILLLAGLSVLLMG